jgi:hypothetical protein
MVGAHPRRPPNQRRHHAHARRITDPQRALDFRGHGCRTRWVALAGNRLGDIEAGDTLDIKCEQVHVVGIGEWMVRAEGEPRSRPKPPIPVPSGVAHDEAAAGREKIEIRLLALGQSFDRVVEETVAPVDGRPAVTLVVCAPRPHFAVELVEFPPHARGVHRTIENGPQKVESRIGDAAGHSNSCGARASIPNCSWYPLASMPYMNRPTPFRSISMWRKSVRHRSRAIRAIRFLAKLRRVALIARRASGRITTLSGRSASKSSLISRTPWPCSHSSVR